MSKLKLLWVGFVLAAIIALFVENHRLQKEVDQCKSYCIQSGSEVSHVLLMVETFWNQAPLEFERIAREIMREELADQEDDPDF